MQIGTAAHVNSSSYALSASSPRAAHHASRGRAGMSGTGFVDLFEPVRRSPTAYRSIDGFGTQQLSVIADGSTPPGQGEWIFASEVDATRRLLKDIRDGQTALSIEERTEGWFCGLFSRACPGFAHKILEDLTQLARTPAGRLLLRELAEHQKSVVIRPTTSSQGGLVKPSKESRARRASLKGPAASGSGSTVYMPIDLTDETFVVYRHPGVRAYTQGREKMVYPRDEEEIAQPRHIILGHELIHAHRAQRGELAPRRTPRQDAYHNQEEFETIAGSGPLTENALRRAFGLPTRYGHFHHRVAP